MLGAGLLFGRSFQEAQVRLQEGRQGREKSQHEQAAGAASPCGPSETLLPNRTFCHVGDILSLP